MTRIRNTQTDRVYTVIEVRPGLDIMVQDHRGNALWILADTVNSGLYEMVAA